MPSPAGFVPPPYPYDRLDDARAVADRHEGGAVDLSIGTPNDPPAPAVVAALAASDAERGYPPSIGTPAFRDAARGWLERRLGVTVDDAEVAATIGSKEFVAGLPHWLRLRAPERDTVLFPEISYPSYAMGATLAGCRAVPVPVGPDGLDVSAIAADDAARALCLWSNTPGNPAGGLDDLDAVVAWGRRHDVPVFSDECYVEFTWAGAPRTALAGGTDGVVAVHSLSKRSNLAGVRVGFYAGDPELVHFLREVRKHAGFMVPGPAQAAAVAALADDGHVEEQRHRYLARLDRLARLLGDGLGLDVDLPGGGFYLWVAAPTGDGWDLVDVLAAELGVVGSPGEFYGDAGRGHVRLALVCPDADLDLIERRLGAGPEGTS